MSASSCEGLATHLAVLVQRRLAALMAAAALRETMAHCRRSFASDWRVGRRARPGLFPSGSFSEGSGAPFPSGRRFHWRRPGGCPHGRLRAGPVGALLLPPQQQHPGRGAGGTRPVRHSCVHKDQTSCRTPPRALRLLRRSSVDPRFVLLASE
ncbi:hypothetical protein HPB50_014609 [Hyalomma asiaticum]|uniref:Uncharacterized protein n=1 Tax=Hyalomma asiaticum TaxID=266040 RepID=A0ACB7TIS4_HYAAI|nr:hypothetical protein HPB50_014609 [Hyalomma asiaticum]